jgi:hypothetical protein
VIEESKNEPRINAKGKNLLGFVFIRANSRQDFLITAMSAMTCDYGDLCSSAYSFPPCFKGFLKVRLK